MILLPCTIISGDMIASELARTIPECILTTTDRTDKPALVVVSAASATISDIARLTQLRSHLMGHVIWVLPRDNAAAEAIVTLASKFRDDCVGAASDFNTPAGQTLVLTIKQEIGHERQVPQARFRKHPRS